MIYKFTNGTVADAEEVNQNFTEVQEFAAVGIAQNAYQTLQANNIFENKDFLVVDEFTSPTGFKSTVDTANTTAIYDVNNNQYILSDEDGDAFEDGVFDDTKWSSTHNPSEGVGSLKINASGTSNTYMTTKFDIFKNSNYAITDTKLFTASSIFNATLYLTDGTNTYTVKDISADSGEDRSVWKFEKSGDSILIWDDDLAQTSADITGWGSEIYLRYRAKRADGSTTCYAMSYYTYNTDSSYNRLYDSNSVIKCDLKTITGNENSITIYSNNELPNNTSITCDFTDGVNTISNKNINSIIDISSLSSGTLSCIFNLNTTDLTQTPQKKGYGGYIK